MVINPINDDPVVIAPDGIIRVSKNSNYVSNRIELRAEDVDDLSRDQQEAESLTFNLQDGPSAGGGTLYNSAGEIIWQDGTIIEGVSLTPVINLGIFYTAAIYYQPDPDFVRLGRELHLESTTRFGTQFLSEVVWIANCFKSWGR